MNVERREDEDAKERAYQERQFAFTNAQQNSSTTSPLNAWQAIDAGVELLAFADSIRDADAFSSRLCENLRCEISHLHADVLDAALQRSDVRALRAALVDDTAVFELAGLPISSWPNGRRPLFVAAADAPAPNVVADRVCPISTNFAHLNVPSVAMNAVQFQPQPPLLVPSVAPTAARSSAISKQPKRQPFYGNARPGGVDAATTTTTTAPVTMVPRSVVGACDGDGVPKLSRAQRQRAADAQVEAEERAQAAAMAAAAAAARAAPPPLAADSIKSAGDLFRADPKNRRVLHNSDGNGNVNGNVGGATADASNGDAVRKRKFQTPFRVDDANGGGGGGGTAKRANGDDGKRKPGDNPVLDALLEVGLVFFLFSRVRIHGSHFIGSGLIPFIRTQDFLHFNWCRHKQF
jgi:hypothetical protein